MSRAASKLPATPDNVAGMVGASLHRLTTDGEGESTVTFKIPLSALEDVTKMRRWTGKPLTLYVKREAEGP